MANRRHLLLFGGGVLIWVGGIRAVPYLTSRFAGFDFVELDRPAGFRELVSAEGSTSSGGGLDFMAGLDPADPLPEGLMQRVEAAPAEALFDAPPEGPATPVAYFFDYYCPYCRVLSGHLSNLVATTGIALTRHHWPIFGGASVLAARASIAAGMQGAGDALHDRLIQTPVRVTPPYLEELAADLGLSWAVLARDMQGPAVTAALARSRALARLFAFPGTPALVVGRSVVVGEIGEARLRDLAELERDGG